MVQRKPLFLDDGTGHQGFDELTDDDLATASQPLDSDLTAIAALTTTAFGRALLALADPADATKFLNGTGVFSVPTGGSSGSFLSIAKWA